MVWKIFAKQFLMIFKINVKNMSNLINFYIDYFKYKKISTAKFRDLYTCLGDDTKTTPFEPHYFYQGAWAMDRIVKNNPKNHIDVGSDIKFVGWLSQLVNTIFVDIRPFKTDLKNLKIIKGDILNLPFKKNSVISLSCLHVAEHIGLGRYGDELDNDGTKKACVEIRRILSKKGKLYFSVPIGKEKECFNAHRIFNPNTILDYFKDLKLLEFSVIDDTGKFIENADINKYSNANFSCGLFIFEK